MTSTPKAETRSLAALVGGGYGDFWHFKGRYRVVKGSRASKKSKDTSLWFMANLSKSTYSQANLLVIRKTYRTLKDSCFSDLCWAIKRLGLSAVWQTKESPLEIVNRVTGQKILFRGLDDPLKVTSISVDHGYLCWMWIEEAYEIMNESDFDTLDESIRGELPDGLFKQITLTFNPWNERHWIKRRFFDAPPDPDRRLFERMKRDNPRRYRVAGLGEWGVSEGLVYEHWTEADFDITDDDFRKAHPDLKSGFGLDFGYTNDPTAAFIGFLDTEKRQIFVWDEIYKKGLSNRAIWNEIQTAGYSKDMFTGDSAEPKSIDELRGYGMRIVGAKKGKDSVNNGIQWLQGFEIVVHPRCVNFLTEIGNYTWAKDRFGRTLNEPIDDFNHLMDAMRYGMEKYIRGDQWLY